LRYLNSSAPLTAQDLLNWKLVQEEGRFYEFFSGSLVISRAVSTSSNHRVTAAPTFILSVLKLWPSGCFHRKYQIKLLFCKMRIEVMFRYLGPAY
jgi:hypothetical protein